MAGGSLKAITAPGVVGTWLSPDGGRLPAQSSDRMWQVVSLGGESMRAPKGLRAPRAGLTPALLRADAALAQCPTLKEGAEHLMKHVQIVDTITRAFTDLVSKVPRSKERGVSLPAKRAKDLTLKAAARGAVVAGTLSLPPGPLGMLTGLPDLMAVWRLQRQLVADIAACYGQTRHLGTEVMVYCLFRHAAAQVVRNLVVRVGERAIIQRASVGVLERLLRRTGIVLTQRVAGRSAARWLPIAGAVGIGAYAFYDTVQVGNTARKLFDRELEIEADASDSSA